jgi:hypothetical protein
MRRSFLTGLVATTCVLFAWVTPGCVGDDPPAAIPNEGGTGGESGNLGNACGGAGECDSGFCTDGVCCESACEGLCETCALPDSRGRCVPVPAGQDPDLECKPLPSVFPDAGPLPSADAGADGGDEAGAGGGEGDTLNLPDGGLERDSKLCAGACNGARACAYPDTSTTCGTTFCNTSEQMGRAACDSRGNCTSLGLDECKAYSCDDQEGACRTTCAAQEDCLDTHFCAASGTCEPKKGNATECTLSTECRSGFCIGEPKSVCCETDCNGDGTSCTSAGNVGKCICPQCPDGPCTLYYRDKDGDGFGDKDGTLDNGGAAFGCASGPPPGSGIKPDKFVANNLDCYDVDDAKGPAVRPTQTLTFTEGYGPGNTNFDYDCNGAITKRYAETSNVPCGFCKNEPLVNGAGVCTKKTTCDSTIQNAGHECGSSGFVLGCDPLKAQAFRTTVGCGLRGTLYTCGRCSSAGGNPTTTSQANTQQGCR